MNTSNHPRKEEKVCPQCGTGDLSEFGKNKSRWDGMQTYCKTCANSYRRGYWEKHGIRQRYGVQGTYESILEKQGGVCALCQQPPEESRLVVDHDHETGQFRGLVHPKCNVLLGCAGDSVEILVAAIRYLKNSTIPFQG